MTRRVTRYDHETGEVYEVFLDDGNPAHRPRWPLASEAAGVHPSQIAEAREFNRQRGVNVDYTKDGRPIFESAGQRKKFLKAWGFFDKSGFE